MGFEFLKEAGRAFEEMGVETSEDMEEALLQRVTNLDLDVDDLDIAYDDGIATVFGLAADDATREKVILAVGNTPGVRTVEDEIDVGTTAGEMEALRAEAIEREEAKRAAMKEAYEAARAEAQEAVDDSASDEERRARLEKMVAKHERLAAKKQREERKARRRERRKEQRRKERKSSTFYTVESGDTLTKIAAEHYGDGSRWPEIFEANRPLIEDPDLIYPGQVLRIPADEE